MDLLADASSLLRSGDAEAALRALAGRLHDDGAADAERARAWLLAAEAHQAVGDFPAAVDAADRAALLARRGDDGSAEAEAACHRAGACLKLGLVRDTMEALEIALARSRSLGDPRVEAKALFVMSNQMLAFDDTDECRRLLEQSLACARRADDEDAAFWALNNISNLVGLQAAERAAAGDHDAARAAVRELVLVVDEALAVARRTGQGLQLAFAVSNLADAYIVEGDHARARELVAEYATLARGCRSRRLLAYANLDEVRMLRAEGHPDAAIALLDTDVHRDLLHGSEDLALRTELALYDMHKAAGRFEAALRHHERAARLNVERLTRKAEQQVGVMSARLEIDRLRRAAHEDALTGIGNRRAADEALSDAIGEPSSSRPLHVAIADIDHFKTVNDTHGHPTGDAVLAAIGRIMRQALRSDDRVFRYGGEEFLLIVEDAGGDVCERLRTAIERFDWETIAPGLAVTVSFGVAKRSGGERSEALLERADRALYRAKRSGRNRVVLV